MPKFLLTSCLPTTLLVLLRKPLSRIKNDLLTFQRNQTNLAIKGIIGLQAMAEIEKLTGNPEKEVEYATIASNYLTFWKAHGINTKANPPHTTLQYNKPSTYGNPHSSSTTRFYLTPRRAPLQHLRRQSLKPQLYPARNLRHAEHLLPDHQTAIRRHPRHTRVVDEARLGDVLCSRGVGGDEGYVYLADCEVDFRDKYP